MAPGEKAAAWIEAYCVYPFGFDRGQHIRLTTEQKEIVRKLFGMNHPAQSPRRYRLIWRCSLSLVRARWPNA